MKPKRLQAGDKVAIVSLSSGVLGEKFVAHELTLGEKRLQELGLTPVYMPNALKGIDYIKKNPQKRAEDLKAAFLDPSIKAIICAIGGEDGYLVLPYLLKDAEFERAVKENPKIFLGFSDSTVHHLMLNKLGLSTFYGPSFLCDFAELDADMLSYTKYWVLNLFVSNPTTKIEPSNVWYKERTDFSPAAIGTPREVFLEERGFIAPCSGGVASGRLYGGCMDIIYQMICPQTAEQKKIYSMFNPLRSDLSNAILFLEPSEECKTPAQFKTMLSALKDHGIFDQAQGVLFGKPINEDNFDEYLQIIKELLPTKKVLYNLNFGHATPRCLIPYDCKCLVDFGAKTVTLTEFFVR